MMMTIHFLVKGYTGIQHSIVSFVVPEIGSHVDIGTVSHTVVDVKYRYLLNTTLVEVWLDEIEE